MMSGGNKQSIIIPRTQAGSLQQMNPMFLPITMANSMSVLTNQGKRAGQLPQSSVLKIQQQVCIPTGDFCLVFPFLFFLLFFLSIGV